MKFTVTRHRNATLNVDLDGYVLGPADETVREIDAEYPALAREALNQLVRETRIETTTRRIRGRVETVTLYLNADAIMAWQTADGVLALCAQVSS